MLGNAQSVDFPPISFAPVPVDELDSESDDDGHDTPFDELTSRQAYCLYVSHSLSMWNSRMYEFSVVRLLPSFFDIRKAQVLETGNKNSRFSSSKLHSPETSELRP